MLARLASPLQAKEKHTLRDVLVAIVIAASIVIIFILLCLCCSKSTKDERELTVRPPPSLLIPQRDCPSLPSNTTKRLPLPPF